MRAPAFMDKQPAPNIAAALVVEEFLRCAVEGNAAAAGALMTRGSAGVRAFDPRGLAGARFRTGEPMVQDERVVVPVALEDRLGQQAMIPLVVVMEEGAARIDVAASVELMMGAQLQIATEDAEEPAGAAAIAAFCQGPVATFARQVQENIGPAIRFEIDVSSFTRGLTPEESVGALQYLARELLHDLGLALREADDRVPLAGRVGGIRVEASSSGPSVAAEGTTIVYRLAAASPSGALARSQLAASLERAVNQISR
jgi:hypothetical protein